jgi:predicted amidohydrolase
MEGLDDSELWKRPLKAGIVQNELQMGDVFGNLRSSEKMIRDCVKIDKPDLLVLPEVFTTGFPYDTLKDNAIENETALESLRELSVELSINLIFTLVIRTPDGYRNRLFLIGRDGEIGGTHDKTHLFSRAGEDRFFTPGDRLNLLRLDEIEIGPLICYEVRFPELSRALVMKGAKILVYPTQWPAHRIFQWDTLLRARAIENQCFVIGANIYGEHSGTMMGGHSIIYSPFGNKLASVGDGEGWSLAELDPSELYRFRKRIPVLDDIRCDLSVEMDDTTSP